MYMEKTTIKEMDQELTADDLKELARLIKSGMTSGRLDNEQYNIYWSLKTEKWEN